MATNTPRPGPCGSDSPNTLEPVELPTHVLGPTPCQSRRPWTTWLTLIEGIAPLVVFLADGGHWVTGQTIFANGG